MAWVDIFQGESALDVRNKLNVLGADNELKAPKRLPQILKSASYILASSDESTLQKCLSASTITITVPVLTTGMEFTFVRYGTGAVTFSAGSGVTIYSANSKYSIETQYKTATLKYITATECLLFGALA